MTLRTGRPASVVSRYMRDSVTVRRKTSGTWAEAGTRTCLVDWSATGNRAAAGVLGDAVGSGAQATGVRVVLEPAADWLIGDQFALDGAVYTIEYLTPVGDELVATDAVRVAYARVQRGFGT